jgi:hypothetical protein
MRERRWSRPAAIAALACSGAFACGGDDAPPASAFDLQPIAASADVFTEPRDAVLVGNGAAFVARATRSTERNAESAGEEGARVDLADRYAVFMIDAPGAAPRKLYDDLVAPFNLATNGRDLLYVADVAGGKDMGGVLVQLTLTGQATPLVEGYQPQGVATDKDGKIYFTGSDPASGAPGVFVVEGGQARSIASGAPFAAPSGLDVADDGTIYVADPTAARNVEDEQVTGNGPSAVFKITGGQVSVVNAGFDGGYPTGIAVLGDRILLSAYADRGANSAVLRIDLASPGSVVVMEDRSGRLKDTYASAGLHRSRDSRRLAWSGGDTVYSIVP